MDDTGALRDLSAHVVDIGAEQVTPHALTKLAAVDLGNLPVIEGAYAPFVNDVRRLFCIGLNYYDHATEMDLPVPEHPILFMKACAVTGASDPIAIPKGATKADWEVELGIVIGKTAKNVAEPEALGHVAGYFIANDVSERSFQMDFGGQWVKGKSADSFAPIGPFLVTRDDVPHVQKLALERFDFMLKRKALPLANARTRFAMLDDPTKSRNAITLDVNGERMQSGNTSTMIFPVPKIIAHVSRFVTLHPGDLIITGTPPGVGVGMTPQRFLKPGDVVRAEIEGLGVLEQDDVASDDAA